MKKVCAQLLAEHIKRSDVLKICEEYAQSCFMNNDSRGQDVAIKIIDGVVAIPSASVSEVVRCKECDYWQGDYRNKVFLCCHPEGLYMPKPDCYCCHGTGKG